MGFRLAKTQDVIFKVGGDDLTHVFDMAKFDIANRHMQDDFISEAGGDKKKIENFQVRKPVSKLVKVYDACIKSVDGYEPEDENEKVIEIPFDELVKLIPSEHKTMAISEIMKTRAVLKDDDAKN